MSPAAWRRSDSSNAGSSGWPAGLGRDAVATEPRALSARSASMSSRSNPDNGLRGTDSLYMGRGAKRRFSSASRPFALQSRLPFSKLPAFFAHPDAGGARLTELKSSHEHGFRQAG